MPPPGRRRSHASKNGLLALLTLFILLFSPTILAANAVLGIDVGTEYIKAALVKPGIPLEIVLTKDSKRKETSAIAFKSSPQQLVSDAKLPERLYGSDALALGPRIPGDVFPNLKHVLGGSQSGAVEIYKSRYPDLDLVEHTNGTITFGSKSFPVGTCSTFSVEELLAMELKSIRGNAEQMAGSEVKDVVITIPPFYSADERRAIEYAAELAGMRVIGLVSDGMAVGLNYATSRTFANVDEGGKPEHHLVYDMGAGSTKATILRMQGRTVKDSGRRNKTIQEVATISVGYDKGLGGDALNDLIVADMVGKFVETNEAKKNKIEASTIKAHGRTMAKLWREAERLRQVLSANTATSAFFEGFYDDLDFRYKLSRSDFETLSLALSERVSAPLNDALNGAGLKFEDLTSIILHGGAVRTPFVQATLERIAGGPAKLKSNVNADEAAVFGAAFKAASLSPSFKVKEIRDLDFAMYPVTLHWASNGKERKQQIFLPNSHAGPVKQMPMKLLDDFSLSFSQRLPLVEIDSSVLEVQTSNVTKTVGELISTYGCARENFSTIVSIRLDPIRVLPEVTKIIVSCDVMESEKKEGIMDGVKGMFGFGKKDDQKALDDEDEDAELIEPLPESSVEATSSSTKSSSAASGSASASNKDAKPIKKTHTIPVRFISKAAGRKLPTDTELTSIIEGLMALDKSDRIRRLREELYNGLEGYTYRVRDMLGSAEFAGVSTSAQREAIERLLGSTNEWIHDEGSAAGIDAIRVKLQELRDLVDPVQKRKEEQTKRPIAVDALRDALRKASSLRGSVSSQVALAASTASEFAASASEKVIPTASPAAEGTPEGVADDGEDEATPIVSSIFAKISSYVDPSAYTEADLTGLTSSVDEAMEWLEDKLLAQKGLTDSDEPALLSGEVEKMTSELKKVTEELQRKKKAYDANKSRSSSSSSVSSKKAASKSKAKMSPSAAAAATESAESGESVKSSPEESRPIEVKHEEL